MKKISIKKLDEIHSLYIRTRDRWACIFCGTSYVPPTNGLQNSHFWSRSHKATRWADENCDSLCYGCHVRHEGDKQGQYRDYKIKQLGEKGYQILEQKARSIFKDHNSQVWRVMKYEEIKKKLKDVDLLVL